MKFIPVVEIWSKMGTLANLLPKFGQIWAKPVRSKIIPFRGSRKWDHHPLSGVLPQLAIQLHNGCLWPARTGIYQFYRACLTCIVTTIGISPGLFYKLIGWYSSMWDTWYTLQYKSQTERDTINPKMINFKVVYTHQNLRNMDDMNENSCPNGCVCLESVNITSAKEYKEIYC